MVVPVDTRGGYYEERWGDADHQFDDGRMDKWLQKNAEPYARTIMDAWTELRGDFRAAYGGELSDYYSMSDVLDTFEE